MTPLCGGRPVATTHRVPRSRQNVTSPSTLASTDLTEDSSSTNPREDNVSRASKIAKFFKKTFEGKFVCLLCKDETYVSKDKDGCTASRWRHLKKFHRDAHKEISPIIGQRAISEMFPETEQRKSRIPGRSSEHHREELVHFILRTGNPLSLVDGKALKILFSYFAQAEVTMPCAKTIRDVVFFMFEEGKVKFRQMLKSVKVLSLTIDIWTSTNQIPLFGITFHRTNDEWALCECVLTLEELTSPHSGDVLADILIKVLKEFCFSLQGLHHHHQQH